MLPSKIDLLIYCPSEICHPPPLFLHFQVTVVKERLKSDTHASHPCSFEGCAEKELVPVLCPYCEENFCLRCHAVVHPGRLFTLRGGARAGVPLLLPTDTVISQSMGVKNWRPLGLEWLPLRSLFRTSLASIEEACPIAFRTAVHSVAPRPLLTLPAFQHGRRASSPMTPPCNRFR